MRIRTKVIVKNYELEERRKALGYNQFDFAEIVGIKHNIYQEIESLKTKPTEEQARAIALEFDVKVDVLFPQGYERLVDVLKNVSDDRIVNLRNPFIENNEDVKLIEAADAKITVNKLIKVLPQREKDIIEYRNGLSTKHPHTLEETANAFGVTRERIRQIEAKAHERMRQYNNNFSERNKRG